MISAGLEGRVPYMTYPEPWRGPPKQPPEFLRPAPKPIPPTSRYNGVSTTTSPNGTRLGGTQQRQLGKYPSPPSIPAPVNLTQHKDELAEELSYPSYRLYSNPPPHFNHFAFPSMYPSPYPHLIRPAYPTTPTLPPLDTYSPTTPTTITSSTFLSPPANFSPPSATIKTGQSILRDKRTAQPTIQQAQTQSSQVPFKVPSGKEGSLKHRILTRPEDAPRGSVATSVPLDLQKPVEAPRKRLIAATQSPPPRSPKKLPAVLLQPPSTTICHNSSPSSSISNFNKGQLIQLCNGELRRIEDMRTEDFVSSAERNAEMRLADSTVVRIEEKHATGTVIITLSYNQRRTQADMETSLEHPFFVYGQGWASCRPERTQQYFNLPVHQLQVGDILVSLVRRDDDISVNSVASSRTSTIMTTATSTAMTVRPISSLVTKTHYENDQINPPPPVISQMQPINLHTKNHLPPPPRPMSPDSLAAKKRRWSAPEICDAEEQNLIKRHRVE